MKFKWISLLLIIGLILPSASMAQPKDPVRDPIKVYKVAILPFLIHSQENLDYLREGIYDILLSRITVEGRIEVIERALVERALYEERPMRLDESSATKIGTRVGADYIVLGSLTKIGNYISLDARMISITEEKPPLTAYTQHKGIDDVMVKIGDFAHEIGTKIIGRRPMVGRQAEPRYPSQRYQPKGGIERLDRMEMDVKKSQTFGFEIKGLDIGDVDGDKKNELVIMDAHNLYIFKYDADKLSLLQKIETGYEHNFLTLDVADVNRNGFAEIIVTSIVEDDLRSFIIEYEQGKFRKITEKANWFFRVLEHPKEGPILMGQKRGSEGIAVGPVYKFIWKKKSFEKGPKMPFPKETNIFGLALASIRDKDKSELIVLDDLERLRIVDPNGKYLWSSQDNFGGTTNFYETLKKKDEGIKWTAPPWRVYIPGRIVTKDLDGDGFYEVIINQNITSGTRLFDKVRKFNNGMIYDLVWDETTLIPNWKTREIKGYISDFQVKDVDNDGDEELVVAVVLPPEEGAEGIFSKKSRSNIQFFKLF
jgi:TolB-like protein